MAKGVKKIKYVEGKIFEKMSVPFKKVTIAPDQFVYFMVAEWDKDTTAVDKKNKLIWLRQENDRKTIIKKMEVDSSKMYGFKIAKKLCGPYSYYIEASMTGKRDFRHTGMYVSGNCPARITSVKWRTGNSGPDMSKSLVLKYGNDVNLTIETEGLNGYKNLLVEIYRKHDNKLIQPLNNVPVVDGEINVTVNNTTIWQAKINKILTKEIFYIKIKNPATGAYLADNSKSVELSPFLNINNATTYSSFVFPPNKTPLKVGENGKKVSRQDPCRYDMITITDKDNKKLPFDIDIYDSKKDPNIKNYETVAGADEESKKEIKLHYEKHSLKGCTTAHKKEVEIFINGKKQKTEVLSNNEINTGLIARSNTILLRTNPELFFFGPDQVTNYQFVAKTCAQPIGLLNVKVYPNIIREVAFVLTLFKTVGFEVNQKFSQREKLTDYNKQKSMQLIRDELEILVQDKGGLGYGLSAKVKIDNVESSIELAKTKSQIKRLISFYHKVSEVLSVFDGRDRKESSIAYKKSVLPKVTFDIEPPNVALALRLSNEKIAGHNEIVRQITGALALKPIIKFKIGVDLLSLLQYMGVGGKIANWIKERVEARYEITIYIIFETFLEARAELSLTYNKIEGFAPGKRMLQVEAGVAVKGGVKSVGKSNMVTVYVTEPDGKQQKVEVEKMKAEASATSSLIYTYEIDADRKGQFSQHKLEFSGLRATIVVYAIRDGMKYSESFKRDFTIIEKPVDPWYKSDKEYTL